jgi:transposase
MHDRFLLLKPPTGSDLPGALGPRQLDAGVPDVGTGLCEAKEDFYAIWDLADRQADKEAYGAWVRRLPEDRAPTFHELTRAMENWENEIFAYFDHPSPTPTLSRSTT